MELQTQKQKIKKGLTSVNLIVQQTFGQQTLERTLEPEALTTGTNAEEYNKAFNSVMMVPYAITLEMVQNLAKQIPVKKMLELCSGPGHFSRLVKKAQVAEQITGVDLSDSMLKIANDNVKKENLHKDIQYIKGDVTRLNETVQDKFDLITFMNGAHHLPSQEAVRKTLINIQNQLTADGIAIVVDPVRLKTKKIAEKYIRTFGQDYLDLGLHHFYDDFYHSVMASFTLEEMAACVPENNGTHVWYQITPFGVQPFQFLVAIPKDKSIQYIKNNKVDLKGLVNPKYHDDFKILKSLIHWGNIKCVSK